MCSYSDAVGADASERRSKYLSIRKSFKVTPTLGSVGSYRVSPTQEGVKAVRFTLLMGKVGVDTCRA